MLIVSDSDEEGCGRTIIVPRSKPPSAASAQVCGVEPKIKMEVKKEEEEEEEEEGIFFGPLDDYDVCDIQCFYCCEIMRAADRFVICEICEGFVACPPCWERHNLSLLELEERKVKLLRRDQRRQHKLWPRLREHSFKMSHADWDSDGGNFRVGTFRELNQLRAEGRANKENGGENGLNRRTSLLSSNDRMNGGPTDKQSPLTSRKSTKRSSLCSPVSSSQPSRKEAPAQESPSQQESTPNIKSVKAAASTLMGLASTQPAASMPSIPTVDRPARHELHHELLHFYAAHPIAHTSSIEVRISHHIIQLIDQPCQLGVFATKSIKAGEDICYYASHLLHHAAARSLKPDQKAYIRQAPDTGGWVLDGAPTSKLFKRPIPKSANGILQLRALKASDFILGNHGLPSWPVGCMINSPAGGQQPREANVATAYQGAKQGQGVPQGSYIKLVARLDIAVGEELLCVYNNNEETQWKLK